MITKASKTQPQAKSWTTNLTPHVRFQRVKDLGDEYNQVLETGTRCSSMFEHRKDKIRNSN